MLLENLLPEVYDEIKQFASQILKREDDDHTLQTTDLVHETYLRLSKIDDVNWESENNVLRAAVAIMRRVLIDHARTKKAKKRQARGHRIYNLDDVTTNDSESAGGFNVLDLDQALVRLSAMDKRKADIVELRYFGGQPVEQIADILQISISTVKRDWEFAKAWLSRELSGYGTAR